MPIGDASNGLCGGMVFAARDYFEAGRTPPPDTTPPSEGPLFDFLVDRSFDSFCLPWGPGRYLALMSPLLPDGETFWTRLGVRGARALMADGAGRMAEDPRRRRRRPSLADRPGHRQVVRIRSTSRKTIKCWCSATTSTAARSRCASTTPTSRDATTSRSRFDTGNPTRPADARRHAGRTSGPRLLPRHLRARDSTVRS